MVNIKETIDCIKHSGLSFSSRQIVYSKFIKEVWSNDSNINQYIGIDSAFDVIVKSIIDTNTIFEDEYMGC